MQEGGLEKKTLFISYCHKDIQKRWIHKLVKELGNNGIECIVDIYDLQLGQDVNYFMEQMKRADKVLILSGKVYKEKADNREGGVGTETQIISNDVYNNVKQTKFIPAFVDKDENGNGYLPHYLESRKYIDFSNNKLFTDTVEEIVNHIYGFSSIKKPKVKKTYKRQSRYRRIIKKVNS